MSKKPSATENDERVQPGRRAFLTGASVGGAALALSGGAAKAATPPAAPDAAAVPMVPSRKAEVEAPAVRESDRPQPTGGSDYMVDALRALGIQHIAQLPGSTFAPLQESIINHGMVTEPKMEMFTCTHEELTVAFAHGYAKVSGEPMAALVHSTVGLQHATMAIYNAYADAAPVIVLTGSLTNPDGRKGFVDWLHAVSDGPALVRDFTKFDETPRTLRHYGESLVRAYKMAMTPPYGPVVLAVDIDLQEEGLPAAPLPKLSKPEISAPQGEISAVREAARMLVAAKMPVIIVDRTARTPEGVKLLVELAETLNAGVVDIGGRMNFPWRHPLNQSWSRGSLMRQADVVIGLEVQDFYGATVGTKAKTISVSTAEYYLRSNYQVFEALKVADLTIAGDSEATLPSLIEAVRVEIGRKGRGQASARRKMLADASAAAFNASREAAAVGWDDKPITTGRLYAEIYDQVRHLDWALLSGAPLQNYWAQKLWDAKEHWQYIGDSGAYGLGYLPGAAVGGAFAHQAHGRLPIAIGGDGDFMIAPGALWTAVYHKIPLLYVIHNNGGYHQEVMKIQLQASARDRGLRRSHIGVELPGIDYAKMAQSMGAFGERVTEPQDLKGAIARALAEVKAGRPALLDVVSQGR